MTYAIYADGEITKEQVISADKIIRSGMIEQVLEDLVLFHSLEEEDIKPAASLMELFGLKVDPTIYREEYEGSVCSMVEAGEFAIDDGSPVCKWRYVS